MSDAEGSSPEPTGLRHRRSLEGLTAFVMYAAASVLIWGIPVIGHLSSRYVAMARNGDVDQGRWFLGWTPWALAHGQSPLYTPYLFAPNGIDLSWSAFVPGPAIVAWPVTAGFGTLVSYNLWMLLAPALAALAAYLVCRRVTDRFWPSVAGGYLFGFSVYVAGQIAGGHLNLVLIFPVPLAVYLAIRHVEGSLGRWVFLGLLMVTLLGMFSISTEVFATCAFFGAIAFALAWVVAGSDRPRIARTALLTLAAYAIAGLLVLPYVAPALRNQPPNLVRSRTAADLLGFVVPRDQTLIGGTAMASVTDRFTDPVRADGSYLGIAGIAVLVGFAITERRRRSTWGLLAFVAIVMILSLGAVLTIRGRPSITLPFSILTHVPLIKNAHADRFTAYAALALGTIAAIWVARARGRAVWIRWPIVVVTALMLLPSVRTPPWHFEDRTPAFFSSGAYASSLRPDEIVAVIAYGKGESMSWQATTDFAFRLPWAYIGIGSLASQGESTGADLTAKNRTTFPSVDGFRRSLAEHDVTAVVIDDAALPTFEGLVRAAGLARVYQGEGVSVWRFR
jgi:hypothetical protein